MKCSPRISVAVMAICTLALASCGLTRDDVANKIRATQNVQNLRTTIHLIQTWREQGQNEGLLTGMRVTDSGLSQLLTDDELDGNFGYEVRLREPIGEPSINVTGITDDADSIKEAQFTWTYAVIPSPLSHLAIRGGTGKAVLRRYDDGWRIETLDLNPGSEPYPLSGNEIQDQQRRVAALQAQQLAQQQAQQRAEEELAEHVAASKNRTKTIWDRRFRVSGVGGFGTVCCMRIILTDVDLSYTSDSSERDGNGMATIWFGNVTGYRYAGASQGGDFWVDYKYSNAATSWYIPMGTDGDRTGTDKNGMALCDALGKALTAWHRKFPDVAPSTNSWLCNPDR